MNTQLPSPDRIVQFDSAGKLTYLDSYSELSNLVAQHSYVIELSYSTVIIHVGSLRWHLFMSDHYRAKTFYSGFIAKYPNAIELCS